MRCLLERLRDCFPRNVVHNTADINQASAALWILDGTLAVSEFFLGLDFLHNCRAAVFHIVLLNIFRGIRKTVTDHIIAHLRAS